MTQGETSSTESDITQPAAAQTLLDESIAFDRWTEVMYQQGCECCRNYSTLTMHVRTLAAGVLAASTFGISSIIVQSINKGIATIPEVAGPVLVVGGLVLVIFAIMLWLVNWHYATAFRAMRDRMRAWERSKAIAHKQERGPAGIWDAHAQARSEARDNIAAIGPFIALAALGFATLSVGIHLWLK